VIDTLPTDIHHYGVQNITRAESIDDKDYDAILFGTALHYALEMLSSFEMHSIADAIIAVKNRYGLELSSDMLDEIKARVEMLIDSIEFQSLLKGATISKEQSISYQGEVKQIDLLLEYEDSYMVIDYKSSQKFTIKHQQQVSLYKKAISQITQKPTDTKIVYILHDRVLIS
jgi:exodeoxyribonuclease V beta subunit